ncbi:ABC transporter permease [Bacillus horti]|uniref:Transport permease protein n=1 Tax=Caldalkalibacillus horti TaxID=77523 RepID=A0ABT9VVR1_9BACI|nr:ABC transporter permease [Bacillus horti]MDQ0165082.1 ABC-2 type transport system permease protein [Bacillus horti]
MKTNQQSSNQNMLHAQGAMEFPIQQGGFRRKITEWLILSRIQFSIIREAWVWIFVMACMFPLTTLMFLRFFTVDPTPEMMTRIITGNMLFGLVIMGLNVMSQEISWQKHQGHFTYYSSLPIAKINFIFANLLRGLIMCVPSFVILAFIGQAVYDLQFTFSWGLILVLMLTVSSVVGLGVLIGFWSPNHQLVNMLAQALMMVVGFMSPVLIDISQLPVFLQWLSYIFPTTYAADAMRTVLIEGWSNSVLINTLILLAYTLVSVFLIIKKVDWRVENK